MSANLSSWMFLLVHMLHPSVSSSALLKAGEVDVILLDAVCVRLNIAAAAGGAVLCDVSLASAILALAEDAPQRAQHGAFDPGAFLFSETADDWPPKPSRVVIYPAPFLPLCGEGRVSPALQPDGPVPVSLWQLSRALSRAHTLLCSVAVSGRIREDSRAWAVRAVLLIQSASSALRHAVHRAEHGDQLSPRAIDSECIPGLVAAISRALKLTAQCLGGLDTIDAVKRDWATRADSLPRAHAAPYGVASKGLPNRDTARHADATKRGDARLVNALAVDFMPAIAQALSLLARLEGSLFKCVDSSVLDSSVALLSVSTAWMDGAVAWLRALRRVAPDTRSNLMVAEETASALGCFASRAAVPMLACLVQLSDACQLQAQSSSLQDHSHGEINRVAHAAETATLAALEFALQWYILSPSRCEHLASTWTLSSRGRFALAVSRAAVIGRSTRPNAFDVTQRVRSARGMLTDVALASVAPQPPKSLWASGSLSRAFQLPQPISPAVATIDTAIDLDALVEICRALQNSGFSLCAIELPVAIGGPATLLERVLAILEASVASTAQPTNALSSLAWYQREVVDGFSRESLPEFDDNPAPFVIADESTPDLASAAMHIISAGEADINSRGDLTTMTRETAQVFLRTRGPLAFVALLDAISPQSVALRGAQPSPLFLISRTGRDGPVRSGDFMDTAYIRNWTAAHTTEEVVVETSGRIDSLQEALMNDDELQLVDVCEIGVDGAFDGKSLGKIASLLKDGVTPTDSGSDSDVSGRRKTRGVGVDGSENGETSSDSDGRAGRSWRNVNGSDSGGETSSDSEGRVGRSWRTEDGSGSSGETSSDSEDRVGRAWRPSSSSSGELSRVNLVRSSDFPPKKPLSEIQHVILDAARNALREGQGGGDIDSVGVIPLVQLTSPDSLAKIASVLQQQAQRLQSPVRDEAPLSLMTSDHICVIEKMIAVLEAGLAAIDTTNEPGAVGLSKPGTSSAAAREAYSAALRRAIVLLPQNRRRAFVTLPVACPV